MHLDQVSVMKVSAC